MTPEERQRVADLFNRLARLEDNPREREAERMIAEGLQIAPNAVYALVQTVLLQEEALVRANERIRELEAHVQSGEQPRSGSFLDTLRGALSRQPAAPPRTSVPSTRPDGLDRSAPMGVPPGFRQDREARGGDGSARFEPRQEVGRGGSFLGQAASIAAGVVVGSLVVDALRGHFGSQAGDGAKAASDAGPWQATAEQDRASEPDRGIEHERADVQEADYETADFDDGGGFDGGDFT
jgi:hypothetical protein